MSNSLNRDFRPKETHESRGILLLLIPLTFSLTGCLLGIYTPNTTSGSTTSSGTTTAVGSYLVDQQSGGLLGSWFLGTTTSSAYAGESTAVLTSSANTYTATYANMQLASGIWSAINTGTWAAQTFGATYDLTPTGWILSPTSATVVDNGDGSTVTVTPSGETAVIVTISRTALDGATITCGTGIVACVSPGVYPAGAGNYSFTYSATLYFLGTKSNLSPAPITDVTGTALTVLPSIGSTFCDPNNGVLSPIFPAPTFGGNNYNVFSLPSGVCTSANITTAMAGTVLFTAQLSSQSTGNNIVPNVLLLSGQSGTYANPGNIIYGLRAGNIWSGFMYLAGVSNAGSSENLPAINAELVANGLSVLP